MTNGRRALPATDDSALPDEERALLALGEVAAVQTAQPG
jgi:hypothetical protein